MNGIDRDDRTARAVLFYLQCISMIVYVREFFFCFVFEVKIFAVDFSSVISAIDETYECSFMYNSITRPFFPLIFFVFSLFK